MHILNAACDVEDVLQELQTQSQCLMLSVGIVLPNATLELDIETGLALWVDGHRYFFIAGRFHSDTNTLDPTEEQQKILNILNAGE